ncbi:MAG: argininosuccinate lyase [Nanoarchaeota archaeon]
MPKLWSKGVDDKAVEEFTVGDDYRYDQMLVPYDLVGSAAHAKTLHKAGLLAEEELKKLLQGLREIKDGIAAGQFAVRPQDEDCHTAIENFLTQRFGEVGKKIHTGRSRNDQSLTMLRLYEKDKLLAAAEACGQLAHALLEISAKHEKTLMPGYTHLRQAMPSSFGLWAGAFAESLLDDIKTLKAAYRRIDKNPLGSAASYGTSLGLDREYSAKLLGFASTPNVLAIANSRGKDDALVIAALHQAMLTLSRMASDLILWSTQEFGFVSLPEELCTGSSIMPQKKNPDILELIRAKAAMVQGHYVSCSSLVKDLPSGYNRDLQLVKKCVVDSFYAAIPSIAMMQRIVAGLKVDVKRCSEACSPELWATEEAYALVKKGMPFREAYQKVAANLDALKKPSKPLLPKVNPALTTILANEEKLLSEEIEKMRTVLL